MTLPPPEPGLVLRYAYLWLAEHRAGREEGVKDRPCAIILTLVDDAEEQRVLVVPVTHTPPSDPATAVELPPAVKAHLGLDDERSWVILSEYNEFRWPGPDLRRVGTGGNDTVAYGFLPPRFFTELRRRFVALARWRAGAYRAASSGPHALPTLPPRLRVKAADAKKRAERISALINRVHGAVVRTVRKTRICEG